MKPFPWIRLGETYISDDGLARADLIINWRMWGPYREILRSPDMTRWQRLSVHWLWLKAQFGLWPNRGGHDAG